MKSLLVTGAYLLGTVSAAGLGEKCFDPVVKCDAGLQCSPLCQNCVPAEFDSNKMHLESSAVVTRCGLTSATSYFNFEYSIVTDMPILYPAGEEELIAVVKTAVANNCKVRPLGARHSSYGVVTGQADTDTIGVSLAKYKSNNAEWVDALDIASQVVRVNAGMSLFDLYKLIRPHNLFLPTQTAGPIFTMGGVTANSVHGGVYGKSYLNSYVQRLEVLVMRNGVPTIEILSDEAELKHWRNSFGLLGIITGVEYKLERRDSFTVQSVDATFSPFNRETVNGYFDSLRNSHLYSETFFNPYQKKVTSVVFATPPANCANIRNDKDCHWDLRHAKCGNTECCEYKFTTSQLCFAKYPSADEAELKARYETLAPAFKDIPYIGAPDLSALDNGLVCLLQELNTAGLPAFAENLVEDQFYSQSFSQIETFVSQNAKDVNDGFWLRGVPNEYHLLAYSIKADMVFDLLTAVVDTVDAVNKENPTHRYIPNVEMRFLSIDSSTSTLMPTNANMNGVVPGDYINCEMVVQGYLGSTDNSWKKGLGMFESRLRAMNAIVHTGKSFCYGEGPDFEPYQDKECIRSIFSDHQKAAFLKYKGEVDPAGVFFGGDATQFFSQATEVKGFSSAQGSAVEL